MSSESFRKLLAEGIRKFAEAGYSSEADLQEWLLRLHRALDLEMPTDDESRVQLARILESIYGREISGGIAKRVPGVARYTVDRVQHQLRSELDRRIYAGSDLIRLNKEAAKQKTLQRFSGWVTSVPKGGSATTDLRKVAREIAKPTKQLKFEARRVAIDQGHKLSAAVAHVVSKQEGAVAAIWHDRGEHDHGYDARPKHLARSGRLFFIRDSWAITQGLIRKNGLEFTEDIEAPAELPFCSCYYEYVTALQELPQDVLTARGRAWLSGARLDSINVVGVDRNPTDAQIEAGNYRKAHVRIHGLEITIENPKGAARRGVDGDGNRWTAIMPAHYGYIKKTVGADSDHLDCYIGPNEASERVWIVAQRDLRTNEFDEEKVLLGFDSRTEAIDAYIAGFSDERGRDRIQYVSEMTIEAFKVRLARAA